MAIRALIEEKIRDFEQQGLPQVFSRDLDLGAIQEPSRGNLVNVVVGMRRCGKTYRLYQEMHRLLAQGYSFDRMLYFNFEDERLKPYSATLLEEVVEAFFAMHPKARSEGAFF